MTYGREDKRQEPTGTFLTKPERQGWLQERQEGVCSSRGDVGTHLDDRISLLLATGVYGRNTEFHLGDKKLRRVRVFPAPTEVTVNQYVKRHTAYGS